MKVAVLGCGILGLWTAYILSRQSFQVTIFSNSDPLNTTSSVAASVLTPFLPGNPNTETFKRQLRWAADTVNFIRTLPISSECLQKIDCYECGFNNLLEADFPVETLDHLDFSEFERIDFSPIVEGLDFAIKYQCYLCDPWIIIPWLIEEIRNNSGEFKFSYFSDAEDIAELDFSLVFNCLGHKSFFSDSDSYPVFGQSMFVPCDKPANLYFGLGAGDHGIFHHKRGFYIGSYFVENVSDTTPKIEIYNRSLRFLNGPYQNICTALNITAPSIDLSGITRVQSGVRPFRKSGPRVEREELFGKTIVHNYGHGAHGWTIGYASSKEAVDLALKLI